MDTRKTTEVRAADGIKSLTILDSVSLNAEGKVTFEISKEDFADFVVNAFGGGERPVPACLVYHEIVVDYAAPVVTGPSGCVRYDDCRAFAFINPVDVATWIQKGIIVREKLTAKQLAVIDAIRIDQR